MTKSEELSRKKTREKLRQLSEQRVSLAVTDSMEEMVRSMLIQEAHRQGMVVAEAVAVMTLGVADGLTMMRVGTGGMVAATGVTTDDQIDYSHYSQLL